MSFRETISELFADTPAAWDLGEVVLEDSDIKQQGIEQVLLSRIHEKIECVCRFMREVYGMEVRPVLGKSSVNNSTVAQFVKARLSVCYNVAGSLRFSLTWQFRPDGGDIGYVEIMSLVQHQHGAGQTYHDGSRWQNGATPGSSSIKDSYRLAFVT